MAKQTGCVLNPNHAGECYVGTKTYDCGDAQQSAEIAQLRADLARVTAERDEAIEDRRQARDDVARAAALLAVRTMDRDEARSVGEAVLAVLEDFGWDLAVLRADIESERLAETVEGCVMLAIERALRAHAAGSVAAEASEPSPPPTAPPLLEWGPDGPRLSEYERKRLERDEARNRDGGDDA